MDISKLNSEEIKELIDNLPSIDPDNELADDLASAIWNHPGYKSLSEVVIDWSWKGIET